MVCSVAAPIPFYYWVIAAIKSLSAQHFNTTILVIFSSFIFVCMCVCQWRCVTINHLIFPPLILALISETDKPINECVERKRWLASTIRICLSNQLLIFIDSTAFIATIYVYTDILNERSQCRYVVWLNVVLIGTICLL